MLKAEEEKEEKHSKLSTLCIFDRFYSFRPEKKVRILFFPGEVDLTHFSVCFSSPSNFNQTKKKFNLKSVNGLNKVNADL